MSTVEGTNIVTGVFKFQPIETPKGQIALLLLQSPACMVKNIFLMTLRLVEVENFPSQKSCFGQPAKSVSSPLAPTKKRSSL